MTSSSAEPASAPSYARISSLLRRPSEQELEAARHLVEHSLAQPKTSSNWRPSITQVSSEQSNPSTRHSPPFRHPETRTESHPSPTNGHEPESRLPPTPPSYHQPDETATSSHETPDPRASPAASSAAGGQMCSNCGTSKTPLWRRSPAGAIICNACGLYYKARNQMRPVGLKRGAGTTSAVLQSDDTVREANTSPSSSTTQAGATYVAADQSAIGTCPGGGRCNGTGGQEACAGCPAYNNRISKAAQVTLRRERRETTSESHGNFTTASSGTNVIIACQNCGTTITPLWRRDEAGHTICNACGLYHKLHGAHRPVQMKKTEIKRRKRVVPAPVGGEVIGSLAGNDAMSDASGPTSEMRNGMSHSVVARPDDTDEALYVSERQHAGGPIPVDFTESFRGNVSQAQIAQEDLHPHPPPHDPFHPAHRSPPGDRTESRKRSFSATIRDASQAPRSGNPSDTDPDRDPNTYHRDRDRDRDPYFHPQNMHIPSSASSTTSSAAPDSAEGQLHRESNPHHHSQLRHHPRLDTGIHNIDPTLPHSATAAAPSERDKASRRAELLRELDRMRQMLVEKEREFAELGG